MALRGLATVACRGCAGAGGGVVENILVAFVRRYFRDMRHGEVRMVALWHDEPRGYAGNIHRIFCSADHLSESRCRILSLVEATNVLATRLDTSHITLLALGSNHNKMVRGRAR